MLKISEYNFSSLYDIASGISTSKSQAGHGSPFVSFSTVFNNYFLPDQLPDLMESSDTEQKLYSIKEGDILLTRTSETIDELAMSCIALKNYPNATFSGFTKRLRPRNGVEKIVYHKYLGFYLRSYLFRKSVTNHSIMTLRASFNEEIFSLLKIYLPEYDEQVKIGDFLFSMHQKIQLNNTINAELEKLAKTLYNYWFVQFDFPDAKGNPYRASGGKMEYNDVLKREIPKGWEVVKFQKLVSSINTGLNPRDNFKLGTGQNNYVTIRNIDSGSLDFTGCAKITDEAMKIIHRRSKISKGDILFTSIEPIGRCYYINEEPKNWDINESVFSIRNNRILLKSDALFYFVISSQEFAKRGESKKVGSVHKGIRIEALKDIDVLIPPIELQEKICKILENTLMDISNNCEVNARLVKLRDFLLPLLMNGQVRVE